MSTLVWEAFDQAPMFVAIVQGPDHVFKYSNAAHRELIGHRDITGLPVREAFPEVEYQGYFELLDQVYQSGEPFKAEAAPASIQRTPGGPSELLFVNFLFQPLLDPDGKPGGILIVGTDVTKEHEQEVLLRESEGRLRALIEQAAAGIAQCDLDGHIIDTNTRFCEITGRTREELLGMTMQEITYSEDLGESVSRFKAASQTGERFFVEKRYVRPDGSIVWVRNHVSPILSAEGTVRALTAVSIDVTAERAASDALRQMNETLEIRVAERTAELEQSNRELLIRNRELQDFAYAASHDLQEPLRKIRTYADLLVEDFGPKLEPELAQYVHRMQEAASRLSRLIADLLKFSRVSTAHGTVQDVDLNQIVNSVRADLDVLLKETGGRIDVVGPLPAVEANPAQMSQLLLSLCSNSLKYRREGVPPLVRISGTVEENHVRLVVEDNGIGFDPRYAERIFSPFKRLHAKHEYGGTGMGLAIARRIAERHGGSISATGVPGAGSRFVVTLPQQG